MGFRFFAFACAVMISAANGTPAVAANASQTWRCWHSPDGRNDKSAAALGLIREDSIVRIEGAEFIAYDVVQDNDVGLVAVISYAETGKTMKHLGADVLVIDKATLDFTKGNVFALATGADNRVRRGKCVVKK